MITVTINFERKADAYWFALLAKESVRRRARLAIGDAGQLQDVLARGFSVSDPQGVDEIKPSRQPFGS